MSATKTRCFLSSFLPLILFRFEKELKQKLAQKATSRLSEETILMKNFKYFDLDNSGAVSREEFSKAIEKAGIQFLNKNVFFFHYSSS
jgi:hypothetical protein